MKNTPIYILLSMLTAINCFSAEQFTIFTEALILSDSKKPIVMHVYLYARNDSDTPINIITGPNATTTCIPNETVSYRVPPVRRTWGKEPVKPRPSDLNIVTLGKNEITLIQILMLEISDLRDIPKKVVYDIDSQFRQFYDVWVGRMEAPITTIPRSNKPHGVMSRME